MATDIKVTKTFTEACAKLASAHHKMEVAICVEKVIWRRSSGKSESTIQIWCAECGEFFSTKNNFAKEHGGE